MTIAIFASGAHNNGIVSVTNITESETNNPEVPFCGARFNRDGSIDLVEGLIPTQVYTQIHAGEWWTNETDADIGDQYQVRCQSVTTGSPDTVWSQQAAAVGTYVTLSSAREWHVHAIVQKNPNTKSITVSSFQIRHAISLVVLDTFNVSVTSIRN